jgi:TM2 domain-containing membrane protein YozV
MAPVPSESTVLAASVDRQRELMLAGPFAGLLSWLVPGLGHLYLGQRARGLVCLVTITATFWTGVAIGSVQATVDPRERTLWFLAQLCTGGNTLVAYAWHKGVSPDPQVPSVSAPVPHWLSVDVAVHYTGVAGLLNLLVILDALARAELAAAGSHGSRDRPKGGT